MATSAAEQKLDQVLAALQANQKRDVALRKLVKATAEQVDNLAAAVGTGDDALKARITKSKSEILSAIAELQGVPTA